MQLMSLYWQACRWSEERGTVARFYPVSWNARFRMRQQAAHGQQSLSRQLFSGRHSPKSDWEAVYTQNALRHHPTRVRMMEIENVLPWTRIIGIHRVCSHGFWFMYPSCHSTPRGESDLSWHLATPTATMAMPLTRMPWRDSEPTEYCRQVDERPYSDSGPN